jgi:phenylpropionate dioxygenase-like ring-hydroxylating dioxygenase large terminal subunit
MSYDTFFTPVLFEKELIQNSPKQVWLKETPVVLVRIEKAIYAYEDFCPHRGAPLSKGFVQNGVLMCKYHGWQFNTKGENICVPVKNESIACSLQKIIVRVEYGIIWISKQIDTHIPKISSATPTFTLSGTIQANLLNTLENFLEGSHTHFVHDGLVRSIETKRQKIEAILKPSETGFTVHYQTEPPKGLVTYLTLAKYKSLKAVSTYIYPNISILEYWNVANTLVARVEAILSEQKTNTRYQARIFLNLGLLTSIAKIIAKPLFKKIIQQDKIILELQEQNINHFKNRSFVSDETDIVGTEIQKWLYSNATKATEPIPFTVYW